MDEYNFGTVPGGALPTLSDEALARLADMVAARLAGLKIRTLPSQGRDHGFESRMRYHYARRGHFPSGEMTLSDLLDRYALVALSEGQSESSISLVKHSVGLLDDFLGGISDVSAVTADDLRRLIVDLGHRTKWQGTDQARNEPISSTAIITYVKRIKTFWTLARAREDRQGECPGRCTSAEVQPEAATVLRAGCNQKSPEVCDG